MEKQILLKDLLNHFDKLEILGSIDKPVSSLTYDSKKVNLNAIFVAIKGHNFDGHNFISEALSKGSSVIVCEKSPHLIISDQQTISETTWIIVSNSREALGLLADRFFESPSRKMKLIGITGTNGKTTASYILESIFGGLGYKVGVVGTINYRWPGVTMKARQTTPESLDLQRFLMEMTETGIQFCCLEVSSHSIKQSRITGCHFEGVVFTNLGRDHLDFHQNIQDYYETKARLFTNFDYGWALINTDDPYGKKIKEQCKGQVFTYGIRSKADFSARNIRIDKNGVSFSLKSSGGETAITSRLLGKHNIYNLLAACAGAQLCGMNIKDAGSALAEFDNVPGRLERIEEGQNFQVLIDFAHTPDALEKAARACREFTPGRLIVVFGCGGDRDTGKRPLMGKVAAKLSDFVIITSDNPRSEDPQSIVEGIISPLRREKYQNWSVQLDRREAIFEAVRMAKEGDTVLIAGKGHEQEQIFRDRILPFSDGKVAREALIESRCKKWK